MLASSPKLFHFGYRGAPSVDPKTVEFDLDSLSLWLPHSSRPQGRVLGVRLRFFKAYYTIQHLQHEGRIAPGDLVLLFFLLLSEVWYLSCLFAQLGVGGS